MKYPFVTIIIPIRNEAQYIKQCLKAILDQTYPIEQMEILVVDGLSEDGTREIIAQIAQQHPQLRLLDNPKQIAPTAMNIGIQQAKGEIIIRVDGHCEIAPDYVLECVRLLQERDAACVGGPLRTIGIGSVGMAIAVAQSSPFGVGGARFRNPDINQEHYVDTLAFGAYRAEVFEQIGLFDEELVRNQDDELNFRLIQAGDKILMSPKVRTVYYSRATWLKLWKQYYQYGYWKVRVMQKRHGVAAWRHLIPGLFVMSLIESLFLSLITRKWRWFLLVVGPYFLANLTISILTAYKRGWRLLPLLPISFAILHWAYGSGFLAGIGHFVLSPKNKVAQHARTKPHPQRIQPPQKRSSPPGAL
ncbi:MAG: glycosyltransferase [Aliifodinibius sp.]|nr:glycosyltransferase family 2 protein [Fodinibius sp.]NIV13892.1 glycosyltransferase [Fodinibius sp.]NIY27644.1 glycosyltransferase [Fodinibius sp.]